MGSGLNRFAEKWTDGIWLEPVCRKVDRWDLAGTDFLAEKWTD
jgi:hypothetical protein